MLEAQSVAVDVRQEGCVLTIFAGVSLVVEAGEIVDLVGRSGSGKTTLLRVLARLHARKAGAAVFGAGSGSGRTASPRVLAG